MGLGPRAGPEVKLTVAFRRTGSVVGSASMGATATGMGAGAAIGSALATRPWLMMVAIPSAAPLASTEQTAAAAVAARALYQPTKSIWRR